MNIQRCDAVYLPVTNLLPVYVEVWHAANNSVSIETY